MPVGMGIVIYAGLRSGKRFRGKLLIMHRYWRILFIGFVAALLASPAHARGENNAVAVGFGKVGVFDTERHFWGSIELRPRYRYYGVGPLLGVGGSEEQWYVVAGLFYDLSLGSSWTFTPSFGMGGYGSRHDGLELGLPLEFRTALELSYRFSHYQRMAVSLGHISNGELSHLNPGTEVAKLLYIHEFE